MRYRDYNIYIDSPHWKQLREKKFKQVGKKCQCCGRDKVLHVHHIRYKDLIDCELNDLAVLCQPCHECFHKAIKVLLKEPHDYPDVGSIVGLINWFDGSSHGIQLKAWRKAKKAKRAERKRRYGDKKREINLLFDTCRKQGFTTDALKDCIASLQVIVGEQPQIDVAKLLLNYDATENQ